MRTCLFRQFSTRGLTRSWGDDIGTSLKDRAAAAWPCTIETHPIEGRHFIFFIFYFFLSCDLQRRSMYKGIPKAAAPLPVGWGSTVPVLQY